jgi:hypothetical protein
MREQVAKKICGIPGYDASEYSNHPIAPRINLNLG